MGTSAQIEGLLINELEGVVLDAVRLVLLLDSSYLRPELERRDILSQFALITLNGGIVGRLFQCKGAR